MKKVLLIVLSVFAFFSLVSVAHAVSFSDFTNSQKQFYWSCMSKDCISLLLNKNYSAYGQCALSCLSKAGSYKESNATCNDSDGGINYLVKGLVTTDLNSAGKDDYCYTFNKGTPQEKTYLFEGVCKDNKYVAYQKKCTEIGAKYSCLSGACVNMNKIPTISFVSPEDNSTVKGTQIIKTVAKDDDGTINSIKILFSVNGIDFSEIKFCANTPECTFEWDTTKFSNSQYWFKASANDNDGGTALAEASFFVKNNHAPKFDLIGDKSVNEGSELSFLVSATDEDGDNLVYSASGLPEGATFDSNTFTWTPSYEQAGEYEVTFKVSDGKAEDSKAIVVSITDKCDSAVNKWDKTFGGSGNDNASSIQQTTDGGYIVAGQINCSNGGVGCDVWVFKLDSIGNLIWDRTFGGSDYDSANSIQQTTDGGYIVAGSTISKGAGEHDVWVLKLDSSGYLEWDKTFGEGEIDQGTSIQQTTDGGYIVAGWSNLKDTGNNNTLILKLDSNGNLIWDKTFGGSDDWNLAFEIHQTINVGYIVVGKTVSKSTGNEDAWIFKLDSNGNLEWDKTFGGEYGDHAHSIQQTTDGGYIVAAGTNSKGAGDWDAWVLKLDSNGNLECK